MTKYTVQEVELIKTAYSEWKNTYPYTVDNAAQELFAKWLENNTVRKMKVVVSDDLPNNMVVMSNGKELVIGYDFGLQTEDE